MITQFWLKSKSIALAWLQYHRRRIVTLPHSHTSTHHSTSTNLFFSLSPISHTTTSTINASSSSIRFLILLSLRPWRRSHHLRYFPLQGPQPRPPPRRRRIIRSIEHSEISVTSGKSFARIWISSKEGLTMALRGLTTPSVFLKLRRKLMKLFGFAISKILLLLTFPPLLGQSLGTQVQYQFIW